MGVEAGDEGGSGAAGFRIDSYIDGFFGVGVGGIGGVGLVGLYTDGAGIGFGVGVGVGGLYAGVGGLYAGVGVGIGGFFLEGPVPQPEKYLNASRAPFAASPAPLTAPLPAPFTTDFASP